MASGRDDFIIAIRSAFLKKSNKQQFSLLALIVFSIVLIFLSNLNFVGIKYIKVGVNEATYRLSAIISYPEKKINGMQHRHHDKHQQIKTKARTHTEVVQCETRGNENKTNRIKQKKLMVLPRKAFTLHHSERCHMQGVTRNSIVTSKCGGDPPPNTTVHDYDMYQNILH